jgi:hypothetical protein
VPWKYQAVVKAAHWRSCLTSMVGPPLRRDYNGRDVTISLPGKTSLYQIMVFAIFDTIKGSILLQLLTSYEFALRPLAHLEVTFHILILLPSTPLEVTLQLVRILEVATSPFTH